MKIDRNKVIIGLGALAILQICILIFGSLFSSQNIKNTQIKKPLIKNLKKESITFLSIKDSKDIFYIEKDGENWFIKKEDGNKMPGDKFRIESYLDTLINIPKGVVVSNTEDEAVAKEFGFFLPSTQILTINTKENREYKIEFGSAGGAKNSTSYIMFGKEKSIREINSPIAKLTSIIELEWAKKDIFNDLNPIDVGSVEITSNFPWYKGTYKIVHKDTTSDIKGEYILEVNGNSLPAKSENLGLLIENIIGIKIADYKFGDLPDNFKLGSIKFILKNGTSLILDFYNNNAKDDVGNFIVTTNFNNYKYLLHEDAVQNIFKDYKDFE